MIQTKNIQKKGQEAFDLHQKVIEAAQMAQMSFITLARSLYLIKEGDHWETLGHGSFNAYLHDSEMPIPPTMGHALVKTYEQMIIRFKLKEEELIKIGQSKATIIARALEGREIKDSDISDILSEAATNSIHMFRQLLKERTSGIKQDDCEHDYIKFKRCRKCYEISHE